MGPADYGGNGRFVFGHGLRRYIGPKRLLLLAVAAGMFAAAWYGYRSGVLSVAHLEQYRQHHPVLSLGLFLLIYAVSVMTALPTLPLNLAAGFFWGGLWGGVYSSLGVTLGSWGAFALGRRLVGQPLARRFDSRLANRVQEDFARSGWKYVAFARINPIIPTGPLNYLLALTVLPHRTFLWVTFTFLLPPSIAVAYVGDTLQTFVVQQADVGAALRVILAVSASVTILVLLRVVSRMLRNSRLPATDE